MGLVEQIDKWLHSQEANFMNFDRKILTALWVMNECITFEKKPQKLQIAQHFFGFQLAGAAPVLWQSCGKPSTKFPHGGLVECLCIQNISYPFLFENLKFSYLSIFDRKFSYFRNFQKFWNIINLVVALRFLCFITSILIFNIRLTRFSLRLHILHHAKSC